MSFKLQHIPYNGDPVPFETEFLVGHVLVIARPARPQERTRERWRYEPAFRGRRRCAEVQLQVRFKRAPRGTLLVRACPQPLGKMPFGMLALALCRMVLAVIRRFLGSNFTHSFGGKGEAPHMTFPMQQLCSVVRTSQGGMPPRLGSVELRRQQSAAAPWREDQCFDTRHVYTFAYHTQYLDIERWELANLPGMRQLSLETLWGAADQLQVVIFTQGRHGPRRIFVDLRLQRGAAGAMLASSDIAPDALVALSSACEDPCGSCGSSGAVSFCSAKSHRSGSSSEEYGRRRLPARVQGGRATPMRPRRSARRKCRLARCRSILGAACPSIIGLLCCAALATPWLLRGTRFSLGIDAAAVQRLAGPRLAAPEAQTARTCWARVGRWARPLRRR